MDHRSFLRSLSRADRRALAEQKDGPGLRHLAVYIALTVAFAIPVALRVPGWPLLMLPLGILLAFLFNLEHECVHTTPFRTKWINEWCGCISGLLILQPFQWFRYFHFAPSPVHERPGTRPGTGRQTEAEDRPPIRRLRAGAPLLEKTRCFSCFRMRAARPSTNSCRKNAFGQLKTEARISIGIYALVLIFSVWVSPILIWTWLVPLVVGFPFLRLYHLAEHGLCPAVDDMFENSRTVFTNRIVRFVTWNMPYVTSSTTRCRWCRSSGFPDLHRLVREHLKTTGDGYARFTVDYASRLTLGR